MERIKPWFPDIDEPTWDKLTEWAALMREWNEKINLISRKDIENLETHHLAHCLAVTKVLKLMSGARVIDAGTGGGLPGVVMAICYPQAQFLCVDSIGKKIMVVKDISDRLGLDNCEGRHCRVESLTKEFDFVTGRAVTSLAEFIPWVYQLIRPGRKNSLENGLLYWKGGVDEPGIEASRVYDMRELIPDDYYCEKRLFHLRQPALWAYGKKAKFSKLV